MDAVNRLNIIHVAGTKGKGSTCAFAESFLRAHGQRSGYPRKTGLYTSPHLIVPEERIRINFEPISRQMFTKYFFEVWDALCAKPSSDTSIFPRYLQLYALVSFHTFIREGIDVAVYETHHGGEFDATNFITKPRVTAIATLGMDHVAQLGPTIENIAWHKAGIMKTGAAAFASPQDPRAAEVLKNRAREKGVSLEFVNPVPMAGTFSAVQPELQQINCSLAYTAVNALLSAETTSENDLLTSQDVRQGIEQFQWPGRFQTISSPPHRWFLESAHNELSIGQAVTWFGRQTRNDSNTSILRVLIFSQDSTQRDGAGVLSTLATAVCSQHVQFDHVIFTTYIPTAPTKSADSFEGAPDSHSVETSNSQAPENYAKLWRGIAPTTQISVFPYIDEAIAFVEGLSEGSREVHALVTGSQHLVGGTLKLLGATPA